MLDDEHCEDDMFLPFYIVPHWGSTPQKPTFFRNTFTTAEFDAIAPPLTHAQWKSIWNNNPSPETRELLRRRIAVAWHLKYGRRLSHDEPLG
jgi:hypothetical protein